MPQPHAPHGTRLRFGRHSETGRIYLLTAVVHRRDPLFRDIAAGRLLVNELRKLHQQGTVESLAWVVMPDHLHWLVSLQNGSLDTLMRFLKGRSGRVINAHLQRTGALWQHGYHDRALRGEDDIKALARYVIANPLRAGLVDRIGDYPLWDAVWL
jgi:REP element-mobilizing transposase RayT